MSEHPFGLFGSKDTTGDPLKGEPAGMKICCPKCKSDNFRAWTNQYGLHRKCYDCKNVWSGGTTGVLPDLDGTESTAPGVMAPNADDYPSPTSFGPTFDPYGDE